MRGARRLAMHILRSACHVEIFSFFLKYDHLVTHEGFLLLLSLPLSKWSSRRH